MLSHYKAASRRVCIDAHWPTGDLRIQYVLLRLCDRETSFYIEDTGDSSWRLSLMALFIEGSGDGIPEPRVENLKCELRILRSTSWADGVVCGNYTQFYKKKRCEG
jgi:hypothetical protein